MTRKLGEARRAYDRHRHRQIGYGRWVPFTDAAPVRDHARTLLAAGVSVNRLVALSGVPRATIVRLLWGAPSERRGPSSRVRPQTAGAILAVKAAGRDLAGMDVVDATGTRRRLQSLAAVGWSAPRQAAAAGLSLRHVQRILRGYPVVTVATERKVRAAYDRLWDKVPPQDTRSQRIAVSKTRAMAARNGWAVPAGWDDDEIDDPRARPRGIRRAVAS